MPSDSYASCALLKREGQSGEGEEGRLIIRPPEGGGHLREGRWSCRKRGAVRLGKGERDTCNVGVSAGGHGGIVGRALPGTIAGTRQSHPPPVGVGGSGWPSP